MTQFTGAGRSDGIFRAIGMLALGFATGCGEPSPRVQTTDATTTASQASKPAESEQRASAWREDGKTLSSTATMKSQAGFGAQLFLTNNEQFFADWEKPDPPKIVSVEKALRRAPIFTVVILAGMGADPMGNCQVTFDVVVRRPDGSIYGEERDLVGWRRKHPGDPQALQLAEGYMGIVIEESDPAGVYTVEATVHDQIKKVKLDLTTQFRVDQ